MQYRSSAQVKASVYALQDPATGKYIRTDGARPRLKPLAQACLAPATPAGYAWIVQRAACTLAPFGILHELVRIDA